MLSLVRCVLRARCWTRELTIVLQASFGALLFGMDSGTIGGVLTMPTFKA